MDFKSNSFFRVALLLAIYGSFQPISAVRLELSSNYILDYTIILNGYSIQFEIQAINVTGWVGIGLNDNTASMPGSDLFIGGRNASSNYGGDYHVPVNSGNTRPTLDGMQNWNLLNASEQNNVTYLTVTRLLNTTDRSGQDVDIQNASIYLIWAYHDTSDNDSIRHTTRGSIEVNLITGSVGSGSNGCPATGMDIIPHPILCSSYYICLDGESFLQECADDLQFNPEIKECDLPENVNCSIYPECPPDGVSYFPYPGNCSLYFLCVGGDSFVRECAPGLCFDPEELKCRRQESSTFGIDVPNTKIFERGSLFYSENNDKCQQDIKEGFQLLPSSKARKEFLVCYNGMYRATLECRSGQNFDFSAQKCMF